MEYVTQVPSLRSLGDEAVDALAAAEFVCLLPSDGTMALSTQAWGQFLGYPPEALTSLSFFDLLHPDDRERVFPADDPLRQSSLTLGVSGRVKCADGEFREVMWTVLPAPGSGAVYVIGNAAAFGTATALAAEVERLHADIDVMATMRDNLDLCVTIEEASDVIRRFCKESMGDWPGEVWIMNSSKNLLERIAHWGTSEEVLQTIDPIECWAMRGGRVHSYDMSGRSLPCKHHADKPQRSLCLPLKGASDPIGLLTTWGSSENSELAWHNYLRRTSTIAEVFAMGLANLSIRETLRSQSIRDPLTSLFNRRFLEESFDQELARAERHEDSVGLIVLDLDNFKRFNDEFGHRAGDTALIELGDLLRESIRTEDIACRLGGEEFAILIPGAPLSVTVKRAEELVAAVREVKVHEKGGRSLGPLSVSAGVSVYPDHGKSQGALIDAADTALFAAKSAGRDCVRVATA